MLVILVELFGDKFKELLLPLELVVTGLHLGDKAPLRELQVDDIVNLAEAALVDLLLELKPFIKQISLLVGFSLSGRISIVGRRVYLVAVSVHLNSNNNTCVILVCSSDALSKRSTELWREINMGTLKYIIIV